MAIKKVGVLGCGAMGSGIAAICAQSNYQVMVVEVNNDLLKKGLARVEGYISGAAEKGKITAEQKEASLKRLKGSTALEDLSDCHLVMEAIPENLNLKKEKFTQLDKMCSPETILASNTSTFSITEIASVTKRQEKVIGLHFFNPAHIMRLVEIIPSSRASEQLVREMKEFCQSLGKTPVVVKDSPGFVVNRLLTPFLLDAIRALEARVASMEDIDAAVVTGLNHPMGPLALSDLIGLDVVHDMAESLYKAFKDAKYTPPPLLKQMVLAGSLGRKTKRGFYEYK